MGPISNVPMLAYAPTSIVLFGMRGHRNGPLVFSEKQQQFFAALGVNVQNFLGEDIAAQAIRMAFQLAQLI